MSSLEIVVDGATAAVLEGRSRRLWRVVASLSRPPEAPESSPRRPVVPGLAENLVFEFDEAYTAFVDGFVELPSEGQLLALQAVDQRLAAMVGAKDASLWTEQARRTDPVWDEVRELATRVLTEFGWPADPA